MAAAAVVVVEAMAVEAGSVLILTATRTTAETHI